MSTTQKILLPLLCLLMVPSLWAKERLSIDLPYGEIYRGEQTLKLKKLIKNQYPGYNLKDFNLKAVHLLAKSARGHASATLITGQQMSAAQRIPGKRYDFRSDSPHTFSKIVFHNQAPAGSKWQLLLQGKIKINRLVIILKERGGYNPHPPPGPGPMPRPRQYDYELNQLERELSDSAWRIRQYAAKDLKNYPVPRALIMAVSVMQDSDSDVRSAANSSVNSLMNSIDLKRHANQLEVLLTPLLLESRQWQARQIAAKVLGRLHTAAPLIALLNAMGDSDSDVRTAVKSSISNVMNAYDFKEVVYQELDQITSLMKNDSSWNKRQKAAQILDGAQMVAALSDLIIAAGDSDSDVKTAAKAAIRSIFNANEFPYEARSQVGTIGELLLEHSSWVTRQQAAIALGRIGARSARRFLVSALDDSDSDVRSAARNALRQL